MYSIIYSINSSRALSREMHEFLKKRKKVSFSALKECHCSQDNKNYQSMLLVPTWNDIQQSHMHLPASERGRQQF
jgi:hypothetical protein